MATEIAAETIIVARTHAGPPTMGHGGYVAGLFASRAAAPVQVTLRRPTPLDTELILTGHGDGHFELRSGEDVVADAQPGVLELDVPAAPSLEAARAAEAGSPAHFDGRGVHPTCFGCGQQRSDDGGLAIAAGPVQNAGNEQVAAVWRPATELAGPDGSADSHWVLAALDCPGAFAFIVGGQRAGLLGRIVFEQHDSVAVGQEHIVTGWRVGEDGRKLFAGTALWSADGVLLAAARATWFQMNR